MLFSQFQVKKQTGNQFITTALPFQDDEWQCKMVPAGKFNSLLIFFILQM